MRSNAASLFNVPLSVTLGLICTSPALLAQREIQVLSAAAQQTTLDVSGVQVDLSDAVSLDRAVAANPTHGELRLARVSRNIFAPGFPGQEVVARIIEDLSTLRALCRADGGNAAEAVLGLSAQFLDAQRAVYLLVSGNPAGAADLFVRGGVLEQPVVVAGPWRKTPGTTGNVPGMPATLLYPVAVLRSGDVDAVARLRDEMPLLEATTSLMSIQHRGSFRQLEGVLEAYRLWGEAQDRAASRVVAERFLELQSSSIAQPPSEGWQQLEHLHGEGSSMEVTPITAELLRLVVPQLASRVLTHEQALQACILGQALVQLDRTTDVALTPTLSILAKLEARWGSRIAADHLRGQNEAASGALKIVLDGAAPGIAATLDSVAQSAAQARSDGLPAQELTLLNLLAGVEPQRVAISPLMPELRWIAASALALSPEQTASPPTPLPLSVTAEALAAPLAYIVAKTPEQRGRAVDRLMRVDYAIIPDTKDHADALAELRTICGQIRAWRAARGTNNEQAIDAALQALEKTAPESTVVWVERRYPKNEEAIYTVYGNPKIHRGSLPPLPLGKLPGGNVSSPGEARLLADLLPRCSDPHAAELKAALFRWLKTETQTIARAGGIAENLRQIYARQVMEVCVRLNETEATTAAASTIPKSLADAKTATEIFARAIIEPSLRAAAIASVAVSARRDELLAQIVDGLGSIQSGVPTALELQPLDATTLIDAGLDLQSNIGERAVEFVLYHVERPLLDDTPLSTAHAAAWACLAKRAPERLASRLLHISGQAPLGLAAPIVIASGRTTIGDVTLQLIAACSVTSADWWRLRNASATFVAQLPLYRATLNTQALELAAKLGALLKLDSGPVAKILAEEIQRHTESPDTPSDPAIQQIVRAEDLLTMAETADGSKKLVAMLERANTLVAHGRPGGQAPVFPPELAMRVGVRGLLRLRSGQVEDGLADLSESSRIDPKATLGGQAAIAHLMIELLKLGRIDAARNLTAPKSENAAVAPLIRTWACMHEIFQGTGALSGIQVPSSKGSLLPAGLTDEVLFLRLLFPALAKSNDAFSRRLTEMAGEILLSSAEIRSDQGTNNFLRTRNDPGAVEVERLRILDTLIDIRSARADWPGAMRLWKERQHCFSELTGIEGLSRIGLVRPLSADVSAYLASPPPTACSNCSLLAAASSAIERLDFVNARQLLTKVPAESNAVRLQLQGRASLGEGDSAAAARCFSEAAEIMRRFSDAAVRWDRMWWLSHSDAPQQAPLRSVARDRRTVEASVEEIVAQLLVARRSELIAPWGSDSVHSMEFTREMSEAFWRNGDFAEATRLLAPIPAMASAVAPMPILAADGNPVLASAIEAAGRLRAGLLGGDGSLRSQLMLLQQMPATAASEVSILLLLLRLNDTDKAQELAARLDKKYSEGTLLPLIRLVINERIGVSEATGAKELEVTIKAYLKALADRGLTKEDINQLLNFLLIPSTQARGLVLQFLAETLERPLSNASWKVEDSGPTVSSNDETAVAPRDRGFAHGIPFRNHVLILEALSTFRADELDVPLSRALPTSTEQLRSYLAVRDGGLTHLDVVLAAVARSGGKSTRDALKRCINTVVAQHRTIGSSEEAMRRSPNSVSLSPFWEAYAALAPREALAAALDFYAQPAQQMKLFERPDNVEVLRDRLGRIDSTQANPTSPVNPPSFGFRSSSYGAPMHQRLCDLIAHVFSSEPEAYRLLPTVDTFLAAVPKLALKPSDDASGYLAYLAIGRQLERELDRLDSPAALLLMTRFAGVDPATFKLKLEHPKVGELAGLLNQKGTIREDLFERSRSRDYAAFGRAPWLADLPGRDLSADVRAAWPLLRTVSFTDPPIIPFATQSRVAATVDELRRGDENRAIGVPATIPADTALRLVEQRNQLTASIGSALATEYLLDATLPIEKASVASAIRDFTEYRDALVAAVKNSKDSSLPRVVIGKELQRTALRLLATTTALRERGGNGSELNLSSLLRYYEQELKAGGRPGAVKTNFVNTPFANERDVAAVPPAPLVKAVQLVARDIYVDPKAKRAYYRETLVFVMNSSQPPVEVQWSGEVPPGFYYLLESGLDRRIFDLTGTSFARRYFSLANYPNYVADQVDLVHASPEVAIPLLLASAQLGEREARFIPMILALRCSSDLDMEAREIYRQVHSEAKSNADARGKVDEYLHAVHRLDVARRQERAAVAERQEIDRRERDVIDPEGYWVDREGWVTYPERGPTGTWVLRRYYSVSRVWVDPAPYRNDAKFAALNRVDALAASARAEAASLQHVDLGILYTQTPDKIRVVDFRFNPETQELAVSYELIFTNGQTRFTTVPSKLGELPVEFQLIIKNNPEVLLRYKPDLAAAIEGSDRQFMRVASDVWALESGSNPELLQLRQQALLAKEIPLVKNLKIEDLEASPGGQRIARGYAVLRWIFDERIQEVATEGKPRPEFVQKLREYWSKR